jgi:hypothetical protein
MCRFYASCHELLDGLTSLYDEACRLKEKRLNDEPGWHSLNGVSLRAAQSPARLAAGHGRSLAVHPDGTVWIADSNSCGQMGYHQERSLSAGVRGAVAAGIYLSHPLISTGEQASVV